MFKRIANKVILVTIIMLIGALVVVGAQRLSAPAVQAAQSKSTYVCTVVNVGVFTNRVHVLCSAPAAGNVWYFAYPTSDSANASRFLSLFETAKATGTALNLAYDTADLSGASFGCLNADCRKIYGATMP